MAYRARPSRTDRFKAMSGVALVYAMMVDALLLVRNDTSRRTEEISPPVLIDIQEPSPPPPQTETGKAKEEEGAAGKQAEPTPVVAPEPRIVVPAKPPIVAAPVAGVGSSPNAGAATAGTGPGAGGSGTGGGGSGSGSSPAQWLSGGLQDSDYPRAALRSRLEGRVSVRFTVLTSGRIANCRVVGSSGSPLLDTTTCRLLTERLRFRPARNSAGQSIETQLGSDYTWGINFRR